MEAELNTNAAEDEIYAMLFTRDHQAFSEANWYAVAGDFDAASFVGYRGGDTVQGPWTLSYPTLDAYRDDWLGQARGMLMPHPQRVVEQLARAARIASIDLHGSVALVRKEFDGVVTAPSGDVELKWRTNYFVRRFESRWKITGFVGYLPLEAA
ncbi:MAG: hypothetical protein ACREFT_01165 [Acetobacteraceae bacterium]